jgi:N4-gp56 family major capsid protein
MATTPLQTTGLINTTGTTSGTLKPDAYYDKLLLKMLRQLNFEFAKYAVEKSLPRNYGDTINWRRYVKLSPTAVPLTEGTTPEGKSISGSSITAVIAQYGDVMYLSDLVELEQLDDVKREYAVELGYLAKETLDLIVRNVLVAEGSAFFAGGNSGLGTLAAFASGSNDDRPKVDDFRKITIAMKKAYLGGNRKAGGKYVALVSPEIMFDLFDDERMQDYMDFGQSNAPFNDGMIVDFFGIRFVEVLNAPTAQNDAVTAHDSIIIGEEAYAITKLEGAGLSVITKGLGSAGVEDPLNQRQSMGWKINGFGARVLNNEAVVNYWSVPSSGSLAAADLPLDKDEVVVVTFKLRTTTPNVTIRAVDQVGGFTTFKAYKGEDGASVVARAVAAGILVATAAGTITPYDAATSGSSLAATELTAADDYFLAVV